MSAHASADHAADLPGFGLERPAPTPARLGHWAAFYLGMPLLLAIPLGWYGAGLASQAGGDLGATRARLELGAAPEDPHQAAQPAAIQLERTR